MFRRVQGRQGVPTGDPAQPAVKLVSPTMERADDCAIAMALRLADDSRTPVTAQIVEAANLAILAPDHDRPLTHHVERHEIAGAGQIAGVADELPAPAEQPVFLKFEHFLVEISPTGQAAAVGNVGAEPAIGRAGGMNAHGADLANCGGNRPVRRAAPVGETRCLATPGEPASRRSPTGSIPTLRPIDAAQSSLPEPSPGRGIPRRCRPWAPR